MFYLEAYEAALKENAELRAALAESGKAVAALQRQVAELTAASRDIAGQIKQVTDKMINAEEQRKLGYMELIRTAQKQSQLDKEALDRSNARLQRMWWYLLLTDLASLAGGYYLGAR